MKTLGASIVIIALFVIFVSCVGMPEITPDGKISTKEETYVPWWKADDHADDMLESKGWKKPAQNLQDESTLCLWLCAGFAVLSGAAFVVAYLTKQHTMIGAGFILGAVAVFWLGVSSIVGWIGYFAGGLLLVALVGLGWKLRNVSIYEMFIHWKDSRNGP